jgi:peptidoglycan/LPS O-acetylase OafA/YrhL
MGSGRSQCCPSWRSTPFPEHVRGGFDLQPGGVNFIGFYTRRVRSIFPTLIVVLVACMIAGWFVMFQGEFRVLGKNVAAAVAIRVGTSFPARGFQTCFLA